MKFNLLASAAIAAAAIVGSHALAQPQTGSQAQPAPATQPPAPGAEAQPAPASPAPATPATPGSQAAPAAPGAAPSQAAPGAPAAAGDVAAEKALFEQTCSACHDLSTVTGQRKTRADWADTVQQMVGMGAQLTDDQAAQVVDYLSKTYPAPAPAQ